jgi:hypothetical protein
MRRLLVGDGLRICEGLAMLLRWRGFEVHAVDDCVAAQHELAAQVSDVDVTD